MFPTTEGGAVEPCQGKGVAVKEAANVLRHAPRCKHVACFEFNVDGVCCGASSS